jgi:hypothetical protein
MIIININDYIHDYCQYKLMIIINNNDYIHDYYQYL